MPKKAPCLPNPILINDPDWSHFDAYLAHNSISPANSPALEAYQMASCHGYLSASELNHCLALQHFGTPSKYADLACDRYGDNIDDRNPNASLAELDSLFSSNGYRFSKDSIVFKGIGLEPFYTILDLSNRSVGDDITFSGFLSTSVCRPKAESFAIGDRRLLLQIAGLDRITAIVPPNRHVPNTATPQIPEQEILLNRGQSFTVTGKEKQADGIVLLHIESHAAQRRG